MYRNFTDPTFKVSDADRFEIERKFKEILINLSDSDEHVDSEETLKILHLIQIFKKREYLSQFLVSEKPILTKPVGDQLAKLVALFGFDYQMKIYLANTVVANWNSIARNCEFIQV